MSWGSPAWFWALLLLPIVAALFAWSERRRRQLLAKLVAARLESSLAGNVSVVKRRVQFALVLAGLALLVIALAAPRLGYTVEQAKRKGRDVLIAVDTSRSMLANDVTPNRLGRAKLAAQDFINALEGDRLGLIAFAGSAFVQAPLTIDYSAVLASLDELDSNVIPLGGTDIAEAIRIAIEAFGKGESESRCLIIFTDGEELSEDAVDAARKAVGHLRIFTVGVGTADGSLISVPGENGTSEFIKDAEGNFVKSRLDEAKLRQIAEVTGGFYVHLQNGPTEMKRIVEDGLGKLKENEIDARMSRRPVERYQWPLGLGLALIIASALMNDRRGGRTRPGILTNPKRPPVRARAPAPVAVLLMLACASGTLRADNNGAEELYKQGKFDEARKKYEDALRKRPNLPELQYNKGTTDYALGEYDSAVYEFGKALQSRDPKFRAQAEYNLGTALLQRALRRNEFTEEKRRRADLTNALQHLREAVKLDPTRKNADINGGIAKRELEKPKPTPPPKQNTNDKNKKDDKDQKDQDKQDQQSKDQQSKDQQSKDQQSKDQQSKDQQSKDQQSKDQQYKDQQSKDQQSKDQQSKDQQSKDQQSKDQQSKDQQSKDQQSKDQQSKDQQSKDQQSKDQQSKDQQSKDQQQANQGQPTPTPSPTDEKKLSGDIKPAQPEKPGEKSGEEAQGALETGTNGEMSKQQARALLDSLKDEDGHPFKPQQRSAAPVLRDW